MTYCCNHARRASELMDNANSELSWSDNLTGGDAFLGGFTLGAWSTTRLASNLDEAQRRIRVGRDYIRQAQQELRNCNCEQEKIRLEEQKQDLQRNNNELRAFISNRPGEITHTTTGQIGSSYFSESWKWKR